MEPYSLGQARSLTPLQMPWPLGLLQTDRDRLTLWQNVCLCTRNPFPETQSLVSAPARGHDLLPQPDHTWSHLSACLGLALCFLQEAAPGLWGALRRLWAWRTGAPAVTPCTRWAPPQGPRVWAMTQ